ATPPASRATARSRSESGRPRSLAGAGSGPPGGRRGPAALALASGGVAQAAGQVAQELLLGEALHGVPQGGIPGATAVVLVAPGDRVIATHRPTLIRRLIHCGQYVHRRPGIG